MFLIYVFYCTINYCSQQDLEAEVESLREDKRKAFKDKIDRNLEMEELRNKMADNERVRNKMADNERVRNKMADNEQVFIYIHYHMKKYKCGYNV